MSFLIFCFWRATVITFLKNSLKFLKDKALRIILKYRITEAKFGGRVADRIIIFERLELILVLYLKMLSAEFPRLVLFHYFFRRHIFAIFMPTC